MNKEYAADYMSMIIRCISSCVQPMQLTCCYDMMLRFKEVFAPMMDRAEMNECMMPIEAVYYQKRAELDI